MSSVDLLSDDLRDRIKSAALLLPIVDQQPFVAAVEAALSKEPTIGPGNLHRIIATTWRQFFKPPEVERDQPDRHRRHSKLRAGEGLL
jgi:hypothetical protein